MSEMCVIFLKLGKNCMRVIVTIGKELREVRSCLSMASSQKT